MEEKETKKDAMAPTDRYVNQNRRRPTQVKNKQPAPVQITAEQILREAEEHRQEPFKAPERRIEDPEELAEHRLQKRKEFEDTLRRQRMNMGIWTRYALWEASQKQFERARSVFERAVDVDYRNQTLWLKYAEMEMKNKFVQHARNVWDRAITLLPRVDQFWYKYAYMEELLGNIAGARQIFERWMQWKPDFHAWNSYIKLEVRHKNIERARGIYERMLRVINEVSSYLKYAKFEIKQGEISKARLILERAMEELGEDSNDEELFIAFAKFEESQKEYDRARVIYKYALDHLPKHRAEQLYKRYIAFEKQNGNREGVETVIHSQRRFQYEEALKENPLNYDIWFDYIRLEESKGEIDKIREVYERAIAQIPPSNEKRFWKRYIYIWINFALFEELQAKDLARTRDVYKKCLEIIPHKVFTFSKIWLQAAHLEVRLKNLPIARQLLGTALGKCPRDKIFKGYIDLETQLFEIDRVRKLYEKYLEFMPENCAAWAKYAELEANLNEIDRARGIFELAVTQPVLDMPEVVWKAYIDTEIKQGEYDRTRVLYKRLLQKTKHVKVWVSCAQFEASIKEINRARAVFQEADEYFKAMPEQREERKMLLEANLELEMKHGTKDTQERAKAKLPKRVKKKRQILLEDGTEAGWEEYWHYIFPDEVQKTGALKILEMARKWKKQRLAESTSEFTEESTASPPSSSSSASSSSSSSSSASSSASTPATPPRDRPMWADDDD